MSSLKSVQMPGKLPGHTSSSLEALETNESARWAETRGQAALHAKWSAERAFIISALLGGKNRRLWKRASKIEQCCAFPGVGKDCKNRPILFLHRCKDRMCSRCQCQRGRVATEKISSKVRGMNAARFMTLTLKHRQASLSGELVRLASAFKSLRKEPLWKERVVSGVYAIEVTRNAQTALWHVHLHVIVDGGFIAQPQLSALWLKATGDSAIVDIRAVHDRNRTAKYIAAYVSKPSEVKGWPDSAVREYAEALHGRRMVHTFGKLHGESIDPGEKDVENKGVKEICSLHRLRVRASLGNVDAERACEILARCGNMWRMSMGLSPLPSSTPTVVVEDWEMAFAMQVATKIGDEPGVLPEPERPIRDAHKPVTTVTQPDLLDVAPYARHHV